uniref:Codakine isoform 2 n=1 Tax=Codakia orbicularis TaxID=13016 RepID=A5JPG5_9BIVA|nr:codakine isoform 2 [Codakia orbicularis]
MKILVAVFLVLVVVGTAAAGCPDGWTQFLDLCYIYQSAKASWASAQSSCQALGGILAEPDTACENEVLIHMCKENGDAGSFGPWLGGQKVGGAWQWSSSGAAFDYLRWGPHEPNNSGGNEDCLHYNWLSWNDLRCHYQASYLCQRAAE